MNPSPPEERPGKLRRIVHIIEDTVACSHTIQCVLLLHFLSRSAESTVHFTLLVIGLITILYFNGCRHLGRLAYETATLFSYLVLILKGVLKLSFIFALYEVILEILGYHSEDYKKIKHNAEILITEFSSVSCTLVVNTTADGAVVLGTNDVINLCHAIWYILYIVTIGVGIYMAIPNSDRIRREDFWTNVYLSLLMVVVWKIFESFLFYGVWWSSEFHRTACVYIHYIRHGDAGFESAFYKQ